MPDETDHRILALLVQRPFDSFENIGRRVSLTGTAVKSRLDALTRDGVLEGIRGLPAASVFGRHARIYHFEDQRPDPELLSRVVKTDPVVIAGIHHDSVLGVLAYVEDRDSGVPAELVKELGEPAAITTPLVPPPGDPAPVPSSMELKVMRQLVLNSRTPPAEIARKTGLSQRTVRRVRDGVVEKKLLEVVTNLQSARSSGMLIYWVFIQFEDGDHGALNEAAYPGSFVIGKLHQPPGRILLCKAMSLGDVVEQQERARKLAGVKDVRVVLDLLLAFSASRLVGWIDQELEKWKRLRFAGPARVVASGGRVVPEEERSFSLVSAAPVPSPTLQGRFR